MPKQLKDIGEFGLIDLIRRQTVCSGEVIRGIGDDAAVLPRGKKGYLLFTTDMLVEDVHFTRRMEPEQIGHKALACSISDIAAMGGLPTYAVVSLGAPGRTALSFVQGILKGFRKLAGKYHVSLVGGDTVASKKMVINVALLGEVLPARLVLRSGARRGDMIFTTGPLGNSLKSGKHCSFEPRIKESQFLVKHCKPSAMIDISDGLLADLGHILESSRVGAELYRENIPRAPGAALRNAFEDGEDFELLFTLSQQQAGKLAHAPQRYTFYPIGKIVEKAKGLKLVDQNGRKKPLIRTGYEHF